MLLPIVERRESRSTRSKANGKTMPSANVSCVHAAHFSTSTEEFCLIGEEWSDIDAANRWLEENYIPTESDDAAGD